MRKLWTLEEGVQLRKLVKQNTPAHIIARKLGRSIDPVYVKASREGISEAYAEFQTRPKWEKFSTSLSVRLSFSRGVAHYRTTRWA
jgi:hypothetical protein